MIAKLRGLFIRQLSSPRKLFLTGACGPRCDRAGASVNQEGNRYAERRAGRPLPPRRVPVSDPGAFDRRNRGMRRRSRKVRAMARHAGDEADRKWRSAGYIFLPWVDALVRHPRILDAVESLVGPDILVYTSTFFIKEPNSPTFAAWHQDATYFGLAPHEHVTAWVALTDATSEAGCMEVVSSHGAPQPAPPRRSRARRQHQRRRAGDRRAVRQGRCRGDGIAGRQLFAAPHIVPAPLSAQPGIAPADRVRDQLYSGVGSDDRLLPVVGASRARP